MDTNSSADPAIEADLASAMSAIREARTDFSRVGARTGAADVAEIRAGRFLATHGDSLLLMISRARGDLKVAA